METLNKNQQFLAENIDKWKAGADIVGYYANEQRAVFFEKTLTGDLYDLNGFPMGEKPDFTLTREQYELATQK